uniref:Uncharacterized protein n=1 Tax=Romanomermis culicivorax TaxID=13658 RepID=A0A915L2S0_ROMCU
MQECCHNATQFATKSIVKKPQAYGNWVIGSQASIHNFTFLNPGSQELFSNFFVTKVALVFANTSQ